MYFPVVVYWCQYNWLSASLIKFLLESKFAAKNAKTSSSSQGSRLGNIMKLTFNSNLTVNEAAPVCVSSSHIRDVSLLFLTQRKTDINLTACDYLFLRVKIQHPSFKWVFPVQTQAAGKWRMSPFCFGTIAVKSHLVHHAAKHIRDPPNKTSEAQ